MEDTKQTNPEALPMKKNELFELTDTQDGIKSR